MDSFCLYRSIFDALMACDPSTCKDVLRMIGEYAMDGRIPETPGNAFGMFLTIRPLLDSRRKKAEAGKIGGSKRVENARLLESASSKTQALPKQTQAKEERIKEESIKREKEKKEKEKSPVPEYPYKEIVDYLNQKAGKQFLDRSKDTREHIRARFSEGHTLDDFFLVIDNMVGNWKADPKMNQYLRPSTLFGSSTKFENYMNMKPQKQKPKNSFNNFPQREYNMDDLERRLLGASKG